MKATISISHIYGTKNGVELRLTYRGRIIARRDGLHADTGELIQTLHIIALGLGYTTTKTVYQ